jgi:hypothetical protein
MFTARTFSDFRTKNWIALHEHFARDILFPRSALSCHTCCSYEGEEGIDAGGVFKDWLGNISRELLKPGALFLPCLSASGASVRCLRLNPLPSEFGVANEAQVLQHSQCSWRHA